MKKEENKSSKFHRQQLLDKLFRNTGGYTYDELITRLSIDLDVDYISKRTIQYDIRVHIPEQTRSVFRGCSQQSEGLK